jgi:hypothetical protein
MIGRADRIRLSVQKLSEAIWNLDQLEPLDPELKFQYSRIQEARAYLMKLLKDEIKDAK